MINVYSFWDEHYRIEDGELRNMIAELVINELTDTAGWTRDDLMRPRYTHPMTRRKSFLKKVSILDILADFIIKAKMSEETKANHPVKNADAAYYDDHVRSKKVISLDALLDGGVQIDGYTGQVYYPKENLEAA
ncbi:hypothetical protein [Paenibacillus sp. 453mf]|uniref:hypothetical protein n=1 Tax=Paenibacillus sp. 453mf TaxID=1761874 RepID=UPI0008E33BEA|nr:hypothetical protein [Paenibacillus sp. 453mf]SFS76207.1 hypothetical protein SAMN04488601_10346 [Paenibacillus sp. 453mf]